ncbi:MAG: GNAT family N-acetyltransferase [Candidatus Lokiarchaeota archaeon]|nr:GNAT family N-acetyltransferase [Candidatus Lokiarchaeota archaeon]
MKDEFHLRSALPSDVSRITVLWSNLMEFHEPIDNIFERSPDAQNHFQSYLNSRLEPPELDATIHQNIQQGVPESRDFFAFVAIDQNTEEIVGYIMGGTSKVSPVFKIQEYGNISDICVSNTHRRLKIGYKLVEKAKRWFKNKGIKHVKIMVASGNQISIAFWRKMGFEPIMYQMHYKFGLDP